MEKLHGDKGTELEMEVRSRLSDKSTSSQEQSADKSDSSSTDEAEWGGGGERGGGGLKPHYQVSQFICPLL